MEMKQWCLEWDQTPKYVLGILDKYLPTYTVLLNKKHTHCILKINNSTYTHKKKVLQFYENLQNHSPTKFDNLTVL